MTYQFLPHTADIRVAIEAPTLGALYADAADVMRELLAGHGTVEAREQRPLHVTGTEHGEMLLNFLRELLHQFETDGFVPARVQIQEVGAAGVTAEVHGELFEPARHEVQPEVKAVTRHGLVVRQTDAGWHVEIVFDV